VTHIGQSGIYKCNKCGNKFESQEGGGFIFDEYRCVNCDEIKQVRLISKNDRRPAEPVGKCDACGGEVREDLQPMCQKCKSREVKIEKVTMYYD